MITCIKLHQNKYTGSIWNNIISISPTLGNTYHTVIRVHSTVCTESLQ